MKASKKKVGIIAMIVGLVGLLMECAPNLFGI